jgi:hypothetical protein
MKFLKLNRWIAPLGLAMALIPRLTSAQEGDTLNAHMSGAIADAVVFPTGEFPTDVENVQAAVDQGGVVLLKATNVDGQPTAFNFGPAIEGIGSGVDVETDVWVLGETTGPHRTTIGGGFIPFFGLDGHVRIESLNFEGPLLSAIIVIQSSGVEVVGNRITSVVPLPLSFGLTEGRAIKFLANSLPITGTVVVADNVILDMHADISDGIVFDEVEADVQIEGNSMEDVQSNGIFLINSRGAVRIADNFIAPGPGDGGEFALGNGIAIVNNSAVDTSDSSIVVTDNRVICENPNADGMYLAGAGVTIDAPLIARNHVTMRDSFYGAITLYGDVSHGTVSENELDGDAAFAFDIVAFAPGQAAEANTFGGNNISHFGAAVADVFLDVHSRETVVNGRVRSVIDLGVNNRVSGSR